MENSFVKWTDLPAGPLWLTPPDLEPWQVEALARLRARVEPDPEMTWVFSSGTSGVDRVKCLGLTRAAHLASAAAVNRHLGATAADRWLLAIPSYHVGGFAIAARAHLAGSAVDTLPRWDAADFLARVELCGTTLCSLVPTQIFDLVATGRRAPPGLRAIVCGGGALDPALFRAARAAGWPVLPSYGLTETASQIATLALDADPATTPGLTVLDHAEVRLDEGRIEIRGPSVSGVRAVADRAGGVVIDDPRRDGWLLTEDLGELIGQRLRVIGRRDDVVKILGVLVPVPEVEADLRAESPEIARVIVLDVIDPRRGADLIAVTDQTSSLESLAEALGRYNDRAPGPRRIGRLLWVPAIPRTALGKIKRAALRDALGLTP